jgi:hypothetical protein
MEPLQILRTFFPLKYPCPHCKELSWRKSGHNNGGGVQYRLCLTCAREYKVLWSAREVFFGNRSYIVSRQEAPPLLRSAIGD